MAVIVAVSPSMSASPIETFSIVSPEAAKISGFSRVSLAPLGTVGFATSAAASMSPAAMASKYSCATVSGPYWVRFMFMMTRAPTTTRTRTTPTADRDRMSGSFDLPDFVRSRLGAFASGA